MRLPVVGWFSYLSLNIAIDLATRVQLADFAALGFAQTTDLLARFIYLTFMLTIACFALMRRRPVSSAPGLLPKVTAFFGSFLIIGFAVFPAHETATSLDMVENLASILLIIAGDALAIYVMCFLGRSFSIMPEARRLVTGGPYRFFRHPLYLAEEVAIIGVWLRVASPTSAVFLICHALLQVMRMRFEEAALTEAFPEDYAEYCAKTARIIPGLY